MFCKLKYFTIGIFLTFLIVFSHSAVERPGTPEIISSYSPFLFRYPMQNCTNENITMANILAVLGQYDEDMIVQGFLYYENKTRAKIGIENARMFARYSCKDGSKKLCTMNSDENGEFIFNLADIRETCSNCTTITFYYCPGEHDDFERLSLCLGETITSIPSNCGGFTGGPFENYENDYTYATFPVRFCIPSTTGAAQPLCIGLLVIFGVLGAALFAAGRNPLSFFNFGGPRPPKGRPYRMRPKSVSMTMMSVGRFAGGIVGGALADKIGDKMEGGDKGKEDKEPLDLRGSLTDAGVGPKLANAAVGVANFTGKVNRIKLAVQGVPNRLAVGIFGEKGANMIFGRGTAQSAASARAMMGEAGIGVSPHMEAGPQIQYTTSFKEDLKIALSYLGDMFLQTLMNRYAMGIINVHTIKQKYIYGPLKRLFSPLNKSAKEFITNQEGLAGINPDSINTEYTTNKLGVKRLKVSFTDANGERKSFYLREKELPEFFQALRMVPMGLDEKGRIGYLQVVNAFQTAIIGGLEVNKLETNIDNINTRLQNLQERIDNLKTELNTTTDLKRKEKIEKEIGMLEKTQRSLLTYHAPSLTDHQINQLLEGTKGDERSIKGNLDKLKNNLNELLGSALVWHGLTRSLVFGAYGNFGNVKDEEQREEYKKSKEKEDKRIEELKIKIAEYESKKEFILFGLTGLSAKEQEEYSKLKKEIEELKNSFATQFLELNEEFSKLTFNLTPENIARRERKMEELSIKISALRSVYQEEYGELTKSMSTYSSNYIGLIGNVSVMSTYFVTYGMHEQFSNLNESMVEVQGNVETILVNGTSNFGTLNSENDLEGMRNSMDQANYQIELYNSAFSPLSSTLTPGIMEVLKDDSSFKREFDQFLINVNTFVSEGESPYIETTRIETELNQEKKERERIEEERREIEERIEEIYSYGFSPESKITYGIDPKTNQFNVDFINSAEMQRMREEEERLQRERERLTWEEQAIEEKMMEYQGKYQEEASNVRTTQQNVQIEGWNISFSATSSYIGETQKPKLSWDIDPSMPIATTQHEMYQQYMNLKNEFRTDYNSERNEEVYGKMHNTYQLSNLYSQALEINTNFIEEYNSWSDRQKRNRSDFVETWQNYNEQVGELYELRTSLEKYQYTYHGYLEETRNIMMDFRQTQEEEMKKYSQRSFKSLIHGSAVEFTGAHISGRSAESLPEEIWNGIKSIFGTAKEKPTRKTFEQKLDRYSYARDRSFEAINNFETLSDEHFLESIKEAEEINRMRREIKQEREQLYSSLQLPSEENPSAVLSEENGENFRRLEELNETAENITAVQDIYFGNKIEYNRSQSRAVLDESLSDYISGSRNNPRSEPSWIIKHYAEDPTNEQNREMITDAIRARQFSSHYSNEANRHSYEARKQEEYGNQEGVESNSYQGTKNKKISKKFETGYNNLTNAKTEKERKKAQKKLRELFQEYAVE